MISYRLYALGCQYANYINRTIGYQSNLLFEMSKLLGSQDFWVLLKHEPGEKYEFVDASITSFDLRKYTSRDDDLIPHETLYVQIHEHCCDLIDPDPSVSLDMLWPEPDYEREYRETESVELEYWKKQCRDLLPATYLSQSGKNAYKSFIAEFRHDVENVKHLSDIFDVPSWMETKGYAERESGKTGNLTNKKGNTERYRLVNTKPMLVHPSSRLNGTGIDIPLIPVKKSELLFQAGMIHFLGTPLDKAFHKMLSDNPETTKKLYGLDIKDLNIKPLKLLPVAKKDRLKTDEVRKQENPISKEVFTAKKSNSMKM